MSYQLPINNENVIPENHRFIWNPVSLVLSQMAAQHPGGFFMHFHAVSKQAAGNFVVGFFNQWQ
jgi:hypothetical protein